MKEARDKCIKCKGRDFELMSFRPDVAIEFGTFYLGDPVTPKLSVCLGCGYSEIFIDDTKDLTDIRKFSQAKKAKTTSEGI